MKIDEHKCDGCGQCVPACAEGALQIVVGKARLTSEIYCDGLGACLGECPQGALTIEEREAKAFDEAAAERHLGQQEKKAPLPCGCPDSAMRTLKPHDTLANKPGTIPPSGLSLWPVQLMLVPPGAPFLREADIPGVRRLRAVRRARFSRQAPCRPRSRGWVSEARRFGALPEKLKAIFKQANPRSITVLRMEVPCCAAMAQAVTEERNEAVPECPLEIQVIEIQDGRATRQAVPSEAKVGVTP